MIKSKIKFAFELVLGLFFFGFSFYGIHLFFKEILNAPWKLSVILILPTIILLLPSIILAYINNYRKYYSTKKDKSKKLKSFNSKSTVIVSMIMMLIATLSLVYSAVLILTPNYLIWGLALGLIGIFLSIYMSKSLVKLASLIVDTLRKKQ